MKHISNQCLMVIGFEVWKRSFHGQLKEKKFIGVRSLKCNGYEKVIRTLIFSMLKL